ncbi:MAG: hypothetical protein ACREF0_05925 [Acetobacteraceae bacterium]
MRLPAAVRSLPAPVVALGVLIKAGFVTVSARAHRAISSSLLLTFALTLRPGREALITAVARELHGTISHEIVITTRRVTVAWCCFFATELTTFATRFLLAPLVVWSFFVNVLDIALVVAMFSADCLCRRHCLQNPPRHSLASMPGIVLDIRNRRREPASLS